MKRGGHNACPFGLRSGNMEIKEYADQDHDMITDKDLEARSGAEAKKKPEPRNKARQPMNKSQEVTA
jgi:hypothetical protein